MEPKLLHIFRNTPLGRETLLNSTYFCRQLDLDIEVYIPRDKKFLMYFEFDAIQVDLDDSYLTGPDTAREHALELLGDWAARARFMEPSQYTATGLPDMPSYYEYMTCPRVLAEQSSKISLGQIGSKVRAILRTAPFPVLIPCGVLKPWKSVVVLYGGSENALKALRVGLKIARASGVPLDVFTQMAGLDREVLEMAVEEAGMASEWDELVRKWHLFESGEFSENLYAVPHDALVVLGAYGHGLIRDLMFGGTMEMVQGCLPNSMLIVGPEVKRSHR